MRSCSVISTTLVEMVSPVFAASLADSLGLKQDTGALIAEVQGGSPAEKAGLKAGDVISKVDGAEVKDSRGLARKIAGLAPGTDVKLSVLRSGVLGARSREAVAKAVELLGIVTRRGLPLSRSSQAAKVRRRVWPRAISFLRLETKPCSTQATCARC